MIKYFTCPEANGNRTWSWFPIWRIAIGTWLLKAPQLEWCGNEHVASTLSIFWQSPLHLWSLQASNNQLIILLRLALSHRDDEHMNLHVLLQGPTRSGVGLNISKEVETNSSYMIDLRWQYRKKLIFPSSLDQWNHKEEFRYANIAWLELSNSEIL